MSGELVEDSVTEKISVVQQEMYEALNINKKASMLSVGPALMPFVVVLASVEGGVLNVTAKKIKDAEAASGEVLKSGH